MIVLLTALAFFGDVTAQTRLPAGTVIDPTHVEGAAEDVDSLIGRQLVRSVFPGRVVTLSDTKEADLVQRNGIVRMRARKGGMVIETKARALGAGAAGDEIMVMNLESRRTISATIVDWNTVEVQL